MHWLLALASDVPLLEGSWVLGELNISGEGVGGELLVWKMWLGGGRLNE